MKLKIALFTLLALVAIVASGCGLAQGILGGGGASAVSSLWSDVPALPNASKVNLDIPLPVTLLIQGFMQAANADNNSGAKLDKFDFVAYQTTDSPQQVSDFYSAEKMAAAGWNEQDQPGCQAGSSEGVSGGFCIFGKEGDAGKHTILLVLPIADDSNNQTQVYYIRFEATETPQ